MTGKKLAYIRISSVDQNIDRQKEQLTKFNIDKYFIDKITGSKLSRPSLDALIDYSRDGDIVYVCSIDRLARNLQHLTTIIETLNDKKVTIFFIKENLLFDGNNTPTSRLFLQLLGSIAEFERSLIKERQKEGIEIAKKAGKYKGRQKKYSDEFIAKIIYELNNTRATKSELAKKYNISRTQLYKYLDDFKHNTVEYQTDLEEFC